MTELVLAPEYTFDRWHVPKHFSARNDTLMARSTVQKKSCSLRAASVFLRSKIHEFEFGYQNWSFSVLVSLQMHFRVASGMAY
jgi:hypothetical protein